MQYLPFNVASHSHAIQYGHLEKKNQIATIVIPTSFGQMLNLLHSHALMRALCKAWLFAQEKAAGEKTGYGLSPLHDCLVADINAWWAGVENTQIGLYKNKPQLDEDCHDTAYCILG